MFCLLKYLKLFKSFTGVEPWVQPKKGPDPTRIQPAHPTIIVYLAAYIEFVFPGGFLSVSLSRVMTRKVPSSPPPLGKCLQGLSHSKSWLKTCFVVNLHHHHHQGGNSNTGDSALLPNYGTLYWDILYIVSRDFLPLCFKISTRALLNRTVRKFY